MTDLISRQAAIDGKIPIQRANGVEIYSDEAVPVEYLKRLPSAEPQWIPCSKRLPKKSGKYYVSGGNKVWICEFLIIQNFTGGWCNDTSNPVVQAWMPYYVPEPYEGDKE